MSGWWAVVVAALVFGVFHEVLFPGRLLTTTFLGLMLGWVRLRSGSVVPCMVLHVVHNGLLLAASYFREELSAQWGVDERVHLPPLWLGLSALGVALGVGVLLKASGAIANSHRPQSKTASV
jgi:ABC-2 type transport system permease protein/sodium transport system permease protein